jgi:hypothetical protein
LTETPTARERATAGMDQAERLELEDALARIVANLEAAE